jgi:methyl-accepting chemotaxis protein
MMPLTASLKPTACINGVSQAASETGSAANEVLGAAGDFSSQSELLRGQVEQFLAIIGAA